MLILDHGQGRIAELCKNLFVTLAVALRERGLQAESLWASGIRNREKSKPPASAFHSVASQPTNRRSRQVTRSKLVCDVEASSRRIESSGQARRRTKPVPSFDEPRLAAASLRATSKVAYNQDSRKPVKAVALQL